MKTPTVSGELKDALKRLRLGPVLDTLAERIVLAEKQEMPLQDFLLLILTDEISRRQSSAARRRADDAGLDPDMVFERWDKTAKVHYDRRVLAELATLRFIEGHRNVIVLGPVGVGKTFIAHALGHLACHGGFQVRVYRADELLRKLRQSRMDNSRDAPMTELTTIDVLIVEDFALEPMSTRCVSPVLP
jgi:DNA replication protein DnaC